MLFTDLGIANVRLNDIIAFTPTAETLKVLDETLRRTAGDSWTRHRIDERLYLGASGQWERTPSLPSHGDDSLRVLARDERALCLRLLADGTCSMTRTIRARREDLVARGGWRIEGGQSFVVNCISPLLNGGGIERVAMDVNPRVNLPLDNQAPYPVFEVELGAADALERLIRGERDEALDKFLMYLVARNYWLDDGVTEASLDQMIDEVLPQALKDEWLLDEYKGRHCLRNLSQGDRVFIAFGRRGTVIVYAPGRDSIRIRCSVLNMVETLRSRFQNLLVASALMDSLLLQLAQIQLEPPLPTGGMSKAENEFLTTLATATYIYGLAVTDPGVQLLDGSVLSVIADRAEVYFDILSLRHACHRKMEALRTIWTSHLDRRRRLLLQELGGLRAVDQGK